MCGTAFPLSVIIELRSITTPLGKPFPSPGSVPQKLDNLAVKKQPKDLGIMDNGK
jgi:hypothetical protein